MTDEKMFVQYKQTGDKSIRDKIINKYIYIAEILSRKFGNRGLEYDDLFQVSSIGLIFAIERFDISKGVKFTSFATPTIIGEIKKHFRDKASLIRVPRRIYEVNQKVNEAKHILTQKLGKTPTVEEIAAFLNIGEETILESIESVGINNIQSLEQSAYNEDETSLYDMVGIEDPTFTSIENKDFIEKTLIGFNDIEKEFIKQRFYNQKTQKQIADMLGVSQMYISRIEKKVLDKFKRDYFKTVN